LALVQEEGVAARQKLICGRRQAMWRDVSVPEKTCGGMTKLRARVVDADRTETDRIATPKLREMLLGPVIAVVVGDSRRFSQASPVLSGQEQWKLSTSDLASNSAKSRERRVGEPTSHRFAEAAGAISSDPKRAAEFSCDNNSLHIPRDSSRPTKPSVWRSTREKIGGTNRGSGHDDQIDEF